MGCSGSKSTGTENSQQNTEKKEGDNGEEDVFITEEEAVQHVMNELGISKERAEKLVKKANKSNDGKISNKELIKLWEIIKERKNEMKAKFDKYDADGTGKVTIEEAVTILKEKWPDVQEKSLKAMVKRYDFDDKGTIDYNEFIYFYANVSAKKEQLKEAWRNLDKDVSGKINSHEASKLLQDECFLDEKMAESLFKDFDQDGNEQLDRAEFEKLFLCLFG